MEFLKYCFYISIISLLFDLIWRLVAFVLVLVLIPFNLMLTRFAGNMKVAGIFSISVIGFLKYYWFTSLIFTITFFSSTGGKIREHMVLYAVIGGVYIGAFFLNGINAKRAEKLKEDVPNISAVITAEVIFLILFLLLYIVLFWVPQIGANSLSVSLINLTNKAINWIWQLEFLGIILGISGIIFILGVILTLIPGLAEALAESSETHRASYSYDTYTPSSSQGGSTASSPISSRY